MESHSDAAAVVGQPLTINHLAAGRFFVQRSNPHHFVNLPGALRKYASAVQTNVIRERLLFCIGVRTLWLCEAHHDDNRKPPFHSSTGLVVQGDLAQTSTG